ncbi:hypothetical protein [Rummeliibacillus stabekisii]|uniref:hypothetical protein n=1 Tax=Rummeliibacillus stabekisii TaxID=241244 RepID=UPI003712B285
MDKTLIIHDETGYVIQQITGSYRVPQGISYIEVEVPEGKRVVSDIGVDVSVTPHQAILEDLPLSETEQLKNKVELQEKALAELTMYISTLVI